MHTKSKTFGLTVPIIALAFLAVTRIDTDSPEHVAVSGKVTFRGTAQSPELIDMGSNEYCATAQDSARHRSQPVSTGAEDGLRDVIVYVEEGPRGTGNSENRAPVLLDQKDCMYVPGVIAMRTSQQLVVRNSDATLHNVHVYATENRGFNIGQPFQGIESNKTFDTPEVGIQVKCDVHGWMTGSIAVFDHDFFAVTDDDGHFSFENLPPGEYTLVAWHQSLGRRTQPMTITAGSTPEVQFEFES